MCILISRTSIIEHPSKIKGVLYMTKQYYFGNTDKSARKPTEDIIAYLESRGFVVKNCEHNKVYQKFDVDLLAFKDGRMYWIEIKVDSYFKTGNYFCETLSNEEKGTLGCFLSTKSHFIFYYFPDQRELHIMDTKKSQAWFIEHQDEFKSRRTATTNRDGSQVWYHTVGKLVSRKTMQKALGIDVINI
jgi:hypothetical protein